MITLYRIFRCWQLRMKWKFGIWKLIDKQVIEFINNPEKLEKKFVDSLVKLIHESNSSN